jgi:hypothetical protein
MTDAAIRRGERPGAGRRGVSSRLYRRCLAEPGGAGAAGARAPLDGARLSCRTRDAPTSDWWQNLGNPKPTPERRDRLAAGIAAETAGRDIARVASQRDKFLVDLLAMKAKARLADG